MPKKVAKRKRASKPKPLAEAVIQAVPISLKVNGKTHSLTVEPRTLLVELLREKLDLTGTHVGCDTTYCGACTVLMNGAAVKSCTMFAVQADGAELLTVEGLEKDGQLHPIQKAFGDSYGLQCGYCTPGLMLSAFRTTTSQAKKTYARPLPATPAGAPGTRIFSRQSS
jgi:aerobic-type carbon monoxide dehydrogenase small subunit (CoxS/CutS family)